MTLAMWSDTERDREGGPASPPDWEKRLPNNSLPYTSTIVFVVRKGNPKGIKDWPDIVKPGVEIVTPNPKTSGNGKLSFLAAWGSVTQRGGSEADALDVREEALRADARPRPRRARRHDDLRAEEDRRRPPHVGERGAPRGARRPKGAVEIVYPPISFLAEPHVAWVDANVKRKGTAAAAEGLPRVPLHARGPGDHRQELLPADQSGRSSRSTRATFPDIKLFKIDAVAKSWDDATDKYFGDGGLFDTLLQAEEVATRATREATP